MYSVTHLITYHFTAYPVYSNRILKTKTQFQFIERKMNSSAYLNADMQKLFHLMEYCRLLSVSNKPSGYKQTHGSLYMWKSAVRQMTSFYIRSRFSYLIS